MGFTEALIALKDGKRIVRQGWSEKETEIRHAHWRLDRPAFMATLDDIKASDWLALDNEVIGYSIFSVVPK